MEKPEQIKEAAVLCEQFEGASSALLPEEIDFIVSKATQYQGVEGDVESYIANAQTVTLEIQEEFTARLDKKTGDFIENVESYLEEKVLGEAECYIISRLVRFVYVSTEEDQVDERLYKMSTSTGKFFNRLDNISEAQE